MLCNGCGQCANVCPYGAITYLEKEFRMPDRTTKIRRVASKADVREMLRVDVCFESLIYPVDGKWKGKRKVEFIDLSCGGIAFFCEEEMERGDQFEIIIPVTPNPLLMRCQVLRTREKNGRSCYAAKFVDMCHDEEKLICEAVFGIQLSQQKRTGREVAQ